MRDAILWAVLEHPDDDTPRLVFADWLEEHGADTDRRQAELIRLQCRLAAGAGRPGDERRERELLAAHGATWAAPLTALLGLPAADTPWDVRRAFFLPGFRLP